MSGRLDSTGMARVLDELVEKSQGIENGKMLYTDKIIREGLE